MWYFLFLLYLLSIPSLPHLRQVKVIELFSLLGGENLFPPSNITVLIEIELDLAVYEVVETSSLQ